jgi:hypothetical protein
MGVSLAAVVHWLFWQKVSEEYETWSLHFCAICDVEFFVQHVLHFVFLDTE